MTKYNIIAQAASCQSQLTGNREEDIVMIASHLLHAYNDAALNCEESLLRTGLQLAELQEALTHYNHNHPRKVKPKE